MPRIAENLEFMQIRAVRSVNRIAPVTELRSYTAYD